MIIDKVYDTNEGGQVRVVDCTHSKRVSVEHLDEFKHVSVVTAQQLRKGNVKNPYRRRVYGVGFLGSGAHKGSSGGVHTAAYRSWNTMLMRCYGSKTHVDRPTYVGCSVAPEWHCFQAFAEWYVAQPNGNSWQLDKDILVEGNKVYGPETCVLVPRQVNSLFLPGSGKGSGLMPGVSHSRTGRFVAEVSKRGKSTGLGTFDTELEAHEAYVNAKAAHVKDLLASDFAFLDSRIKKAILAKL